MKNNSKMSDGEVICGEDKKCSDLAWDMFQKTGQLGYYMLHYELSRDE